MYRLALVVFAMASAASAAEVFRYGRFELALTAPAESAHPLKDAVEVEMTGPKGVQQTVPAFWRGGRKWAVRFSPPRAGAWKYQVKTPGFEPASGRFEAKVYNGPNELLRAGAPKLSASRRYFEHANGKPWFWLADTAWNGALLSTDQEWREYLANRAAKRFTAVQVVMTQWRAGRQDEAGQVAFTTEGGLRINPAFFDRMDKKFEAIVDRGLVAAPVLLWALTSKDKESPGVSLSDADAAALAAYMVARYSAFPVIWILGGDGDYRGANTVRWKSIGRAVFPEGRAHPPVTMHPRGMQDPWAEYKDEPWLDFFMYQSGHGGDVRKWKWNATEGGAVGWKLQPAHPVIDGEINYEGHMSYHKKLIGEYEVRRAAYYSLLAAPVAGVTYGAHGIWFWNRKKEVPLDHASSGVADPWRVCLSYPGAAQMRVLRDVMDEAEWWRLVPDRTLLAADKAAADFSDYIMASRSAKGDIALLYLPGNPAVKLNLAGMKKAAAAEWIDPRTGDRVPVKEKVSGVVELKTPDTKDWLLRLDAR